MATFKVNLKIDQGADFNKRVTWKLGATRVPADLTGCTARMQARASLRDPVVLLDLTTANGGITLGGTAGTVEIALPAAATEMIDWTKAVYDLEIVYSDARVVRLMRGSVTVSQEVTRV